MDQPVPNVTRADVDRIIARDLSPETHDDLRALLTGPDVALPPRLILAVLKLAEGDVEAVSVLVETIEQTHGKEA